MNKTTRQSIFSILSAERPNPESELNFGSPYELLVAVMLSAQATDKSVNAATATLFAKANTPKAMLELGQDQLMDAIRTIGLCRNKAKNVIAMSAILVKDYDSQVPETFAALTSLPGVGAKTANVVLNVAFHQPTIAVDTHVFRVAHRLGLSKGKTPEEVSEELVKSTPKEFLPNAHHWLLLHGRYCCTARAPHCAECPVATLCVSCGKV